MKRPFVILALIAALVAGCASGETTQTDLDRERKAMDEQTPKGLEAAPPSTDTVDMGGPTKKGG